MLLNDIQLPSNQKFGFFFSSVFVIIGGYCFIYATVYLSYAFFLIAILFLIISIAKPDSLSLLNNLWMRLGLLIGMFVSPLILGVIFFCLFTPISLFLKLIRRDELKLHFKDKPTYWLDTKSKINQNHSFKNQF